MINLCRKLHQITGGSLDCGCVCDEVALFLHSLVKLYRPELVIQTGHLWGKSAVAVLEAFEHTPAVDDGGDKFFSAFVESHRPKPRSQKLISIDPHPLNVVRSNDGLLWLKEEYGDKFEFVKKPSSVFFQHFQPQGERIFGIVDGDHSEQGCLADIESLAELDAEIIVVDDTRWIEPLGNVARVAADKFGYGYAEIPLYNGLAILTR